MDIHYTFEPANYWLSRSGCPINRYQTYQVAMIKNG